MFEFVKLFTSPAFHKHDFVAMLAENGIAAKVVADGVVLDRATYNATKNLPAWAEVMWADINNPLKTRAADITEWPYRSRKQYVLFIALESGERVEFMESDSVSYLLDQADFCDQLKIPNWVLDTHTGERVN